MESGSISQGLGFSDFCSKQNPGPCCYILLYETLLADALGRILGDLTWGQLSLAKATCGILCRSPL